MKAEKKSMFWAGVDWGDTAHAVVVVDAWGQIHSRFVVAHSPKGLQEISGRLRQFAPLGGVAIESNRGILLYHLIQQGFTVYPINPKLSHSWRKNDSVSECKSDGRDGRVLAQELCVRHARLHAVRTEEDSVRRLAMLCEDEQALIQERSGLVHALKATLKQYFPGALAFFTDWTCPSAWAWLKRFPTPEKLARTSASTMYRFLKARHICLTPTWQRRVQERGRALDWPCDVALTDVYVLRVEQLLARLQTLQTKLEQYRERINALYEQQDDAGIFVSLPGAGEKLAPRLLTIFGTQRNRYESADAVRALAGPAPVTKGSGRKRIVRMRRACRKPWRTTLHLFANTSTLYCPWARAFYKLCRARGDEHALALRKLADKWLKIIYRMWQTQTPYDDARYLQQLRRKKSPLLDYLVENPVEKAPQNA